MVLLSVTDPIDTRGLSQSNGPSIHRSPSPTSGVEENGYVDSLTSCYKVLAVYHLEPATPQSPKLNPYKGQLEQSKAENSHNYYLSSPTLPSWQHSGPRKKDTFTIDIHSPRSSTLQVENPLAHHRHYKSLSSSTTIPPGRNFHLSQQSAKAPSLLLVSPYSSSIVGI